MSQPPPFVLRNEFAIVEVTPIGRPGGERLLVTDLSTGRSAAFDPVELEGLCWIGDGDRARLASPEWRMRDSPSVSPVFDHPQETGDA
jgi:hypothetical protein